MKKIKIIIILLIAIIGAYLINNKFKDRNIEDIQVDKFLKEYTLLEENHSFKIINIDEAINILNNDTGIILFCNSGSSWCQHYVKLLDEISIEFEEDIDKIHYLDIKEERNMNTNKYKKLVSKLDSILPLDDTGNKRINMPSLLFIKDGKIVAYDTTTSIISSDITSKEYWNEKNIDEFKEKIKNNIELLNKENIIIDETIIEIEEQ